MLAHHVHSSHHGARPCGNTWFHDVREGIRSVFHQTRIMKELRRHSGEDGFQIILNDGREYKITDSYKTDGGRLLFSHHRLGALSFPIVDIKRATSAADY